MIEEIQYTTKRLLGLMSAFNKVAGNKINTPNSAAFLYTNNCLAEKEFIRAIWFTIATKTVKNLGINLTKDMKALY